MGRDLDLVLTDVGMPGIRGDDLVRRVRQTSNVACILMSGSELLSELPVVAVLRKPFGREDLLDAVAKTATGSTESRA
jgi:CheY-like chemotaxis protein